MGKKVPLLVFGLIFAFGMASVVHAQDTSPPTVPSGLSAYLTQSGQIYLSWNPSTDDVGVVGYYVYRDGQLVANTPGLLFYTDNAPAGTHTYTVAAYDATGNVSAQSVPTSPPITVTADTVPPSAPSGFTLDPSSSSIVLSWNASTDNVAVIGYYIYRNGGKLIFQNTLNGTTYTDTNLTPGATYTYQVGAYDAAGNITRSNILSATTIFDVTAPTPPRYLTAKTISSNEIDLQWGPATDNVGVGSYSIYRNNNYVATVLSSTPSYADTGLSPNTLYSYQVVAGDIVGNPSQPSVPAAATTQPPDLTPPSIPSNLRGVSPSTNEVDLSWSASTDNVGVAGYYIYRDGNQIGGTASTSFVDLYLATNTTYLYAVKAYDAAGNISPQSSIGATTLMKNPVTPMNPQPQQQQQQQQQQQNPQPQPYGNSVQSSNSPQPQSSGFAFTTLLSLGLRGTAVQNLQAILIQQGYLGPNYATGYFGALTQKAVQQFQCAQGIVCSGSPFATGWGLVGVRTRKILNSL